MNEIVKHEVNLDELQRMAKLLAVSGYFDAKGDSAQAIAQICTKILAGRELGYGPFSSVQGIHIIQGRPALSANIMAAAVKNSPRYDYRVRKLDCNECSIEYFERTADGKRESLGVSTFTKEDAIKAQVKNTDKFLRNMLFARAMSNGVRWYCPDVFSGNTVYTPEELGASTDDNGVIVVDGSTGEILEERTASPVTKPAMNGNGHANGATKPTPAPVITPAEIAATDAITLDNVPEASDGHDNPFTPDAAQIHRITEGFNIPKDAWAWAVSNHYTENEHSARNRWSTIVKEEFDNSYTPAKMPQIAAVYVKHYLAKASAAQAA